MVPNNSAKTPLIQRIFDSFGSDHTVTPTPHYHSQDEVNGLESALAGKASASDMTTALAAKADKVANATNNNFAALDGNGNLKDSGKKATDFTNSIPSGGPSGAIVIVSNSGQIGRSDKTLSDLMPSTTIDTTPTADSDHLVTSGGVKAALDAKYSINQVDENDEQEAHLSAIAEDDDIYFDFRLKNGNTQKNVLLTISKMDNFARAISNPDTTPTANSDKLVTSGGVKAALDGKAPSGDTEVIFYEGENIFVYLPNYFTNGVRQRSFILNYEGEAAELIDLFGGNTNDSIRILSHDDSIITVAECYIAVRVIKQSGIGAQGDTYYIIFDGKNEY